jgi:hypothetical protein
VTRCWFDRALRGEGIIPRDRLNIQEGFFSNENARPQKGKVPPALSDLAGQASLRECVPRQRGLAAGGMA